MPHDLSSPEDPRLDGYRHLTDAGLRRSYEARHGLFVLEGAMVVRRAVEAGWRLTSLLVLPGALGALSDVAERVEAEGGTVLVAERSTFDIVAGFPVHRGVLALAERTPDRDAAELIRSCRLAVLVEGVNDHENLGSIFRNAAAFGAGAVLLDPTACDPLYRRSVRVSAGHALRVPFARLAPWPEALRKVREAGFVLIALEPGATTPVERLASLLARRRRARRASRSWWAPRVRG